MTATSKELSKRIRNGDSELKQLRKELEESKRKQMALRSKIYQIQTKGQDE